MNSEYASLDPSAISRLRNLLSSAIQKQKVLSKIITIVPDEDIINFVASKCGSAGLFIMGKILHWLMDEYNKLISSQKEYLPTKAKDPDHPHLIWIEAPYHKNFDNNVVCEKFDYCIRNIGHLHSNVSVLALKKIWVPDDNTLFSKEYQRFSATGFR